MGFFWNRTVLRLERLLRAAWRAGAGHMKAAISCVSQAVAPTLAVNFIPARPAALGEQLRTSRRRWRSCRTRRRRCGGLRGVGELPPLLFFWFLACDGAVSRARTWVFSPPGSNFGLCCWNDAVQPRGAAGEETPE